MAGRHKKHRCKGCGHRIGPRRINMTKDGTRPKKAECSHGCHAEKEPTP